PGGGLIPHGCSVVPTRCLRAPSPAGGGRRLAAPPRGGRRRGRGGAARDRAPPMAGETATTFSIPGQESTTALERIGAAFGAAGGTPARVALQAPDGQTLTTPENAAAVQGIVADLAQQPGVTSASDPL